MSWLLLCAMVAATIALALIAWRKWIAPWQEVEELVTQVSRGERPRTFLVRDGAQAHRIGLVLEKIFHNLKQLDKQIAKRESGLQTIFSAMQDALLVVDSDRRVVLANDAFRKLFALPEISPGTPLSILRGYIETLLEIPDTSRKELSRILGVMKRHSNRLDLLAEDLLILAQLESANPNLQLDDVDLSSFFGELIRDWEKKLANKQLNVTVDVAPDLPTIRADRGRLQEALYNLLDNAVKYSREHGEITLVARRRDQQIVLS